MTRKSNKPLTKKQMAVYDIENAIWHLEELKKELTKKALARTRILLVSDALVRITRQVFTPKEYDESLKRFQLDIDKILEKEGYVK